ncbi:MAG TPA: Fe(3+)-hydroxamate ABC transporter permease FhuB [Stellaceae bacterium]|nr:Fe(3+)-hydroxamate ABC transporter permease FhuB [Stellaceae bacterium]
MTPSLRLPAWWTMLAMGLVAVMLSLHLLLGEVPLSQWASAVASPQGVQQAIFAYGTLPRIAVSIGAGAALGLAGVVFQQVLRNPLAEPTTLGTSAGAQLALAAATLYAPSVLDLGREWIALAGAAAATALVFAASWRNTVSPLTLLMAGLIVSLFCGAFGGVLSLLHRDRLESVFIWSTGSLVQDDWSEVAYLLPRLVVAMVAAGLLVRPLSVLGLEDVGARSLGLSLRSVRLLALGVAVSLSAFVVSAVGVIGFIGLAAPALTRLSGMRRFRDQLLWSPVMGATLLWLADQLVQLLGTVMPEVPTGTATALLGAPLLLWMLPRLKEASVPPQAPEREDTHRSANPWHLLVGAVLLLPLLTWLALDFGESLHGWHWATGQELARLLPWRWPRVLAALAAGGMLAAAGNLMQRLSGNALASPEVLGISSGASLGFILLLFIVPFPDQPMQVIAAAGGAFVTLLTMLALGRKSAFSPERMLLAGIALATVFSALASLLMASGDPRMRMLQSWMAGSTYQVTGQAAVIAAAIAIAILAVVPLTGRWLAILPLGETASRELGLDIAWSRLALLLLASILTAAATLIVGPLSFVGLMAPHMARMAGLQRPLSQLAGAVVLGALIMLLADWLGRNLLFPYQIPAGLLAAFIGAPYFLWLMRRQTA